jgi:hypothetical protein
MQTERVRYNGIRERLFTLALIDVSSRWRPDQTLMTTIIFTTAVAAYGKRKAAIRGLDASFTAQG